MVVQREFFVENKEAFHTTLFEGNDTTMLIHTGKQVKPAECTALMEMAFNIMGALG